MERWFDGMFLEHTFHTSDNWIISRTLFKTAIYVHIEYYTQCYSALFIWYTLHFVYGNVHVCDSLSSTELRLDALCTYNNRALHTGKTTTRCSV